VTGPLLFLGCFLLAGFAFAMPLVSAIRLGSRGFGRASLGIPGGALIWSWMAVYAGVMESVWTMYSLMPWLLALFGTIGAGFIVISARAALRSRPKPDQCLNCGYARGDLTRCPECGR
jgi:hypothetical protein